MIKAILIDNDGVLIPKAKEDFCRELAVKYQKEYVALRKSMYASWKKFRLGEISEDDFFEEFIIDSSIDTNKEELKKLYRFFVVINSSLKEWIGRKKHKYDIYLYSNHAKEWSEYLIKEYELDSLFKDYFWSWEMKTKKPENIEEIKKKLLEKHIHPEEAVFIDDNKENIQRAEQAGFNTIHFQSVEQLDKDFKVFEGQK